MIKIMFVCHGNICRSPMAEFLFKDYVKKQNHSEDFYIQSSATSCEELGNPVHYGTKRILSGLNISCENKRATRLTKADYDKFDLFIGMDNANKNNMLNLFNGDKDNKVKLLMDYTPNPRPVADPYYTGNFDVTYSDILEGITALYNNLTK